MAVWREVDRNLVRTLWARGSSSGQIASALPFDVSRSAVMGMVNRLGLMGLGAPSPARLEAIALVEELFETGFSLGEPLHREALLCFALRDAPREAGRLAVASGVAREDCARFLERLPRVWPDGEMAPARWGGDDGNIAFVLDMAVVAGMVDAVPDRGSAPKMAA